MKKLFVLLLFLLVPLALISAQGLHGKILLLQDSVFNSTDSLKSVLGEVYRGHVDTEYSLPSDLLEYDAILIVVLGRNFFPFDSLSVADQLRLIDYLKNGGRIYAEGRFFLTINSLPNDTLPDPEDTLWHYLGLQTEFEDDVVDYYDTIYGVDSEFTKGIQIPQAFGEAFELSTYYPDGNIIPVLLAPESSGGKSLGPVDILAWIPSDISKRVVMHHPIAGFYYGALLTSVLCDYFGLCTDAVKEAPAAVPAATLRVVNDGVSTSLVVSADETGSLDVMNALGVTVYHASVNSGMSRIELPESLRNGVYFARLQTEHGGQVQPFAIVAK